MNTHTSDTTTDAPLVSARGLTKHYEGFSLEGVDLDVREGEIVGFVGKNGAGKSTTIKALLGLIATDSGTSQRARNAQRAALSPGCGRTPRSASAWSSTRSRCPATCASRDVGTIYAHAYDRWDAHRFSRLTDTFDLPVEKCVKDLSRGMGMKLSLACALSHDAHVLILDEATAGLDPMARDEVLDRLRDFVAEPGRAVLMSSHITSDIERIADRVVCIDDGRIVFDLPKDAITDEMGVARCRVADFERVAASGMVPESELRYLRHEYGIDVLVPDRYDFARRFPEIPCDRMTIDDYLTLTLKGGVR